MQQVYSKETQELREANTRAQLEILKQQINPHFLFNAHSTIKSLIRIQDPNAEKFVMNLSDLSSSPQGYWNSTPRWKGLVMTLSESLMSYFFA